MSEIISDGVRSITNDTMNYGNACSYGNGFLNGEGIGYNKGFNIGDGFGYGRGFSNADAIGNVKNNDTSNSWRTDSHGFERAGEIIEAVAAAGVAVEKNGAANELATEKIGAAGQLATEKTAAAIQLANSLAFANTQNLLISGFKDGRYDAAVNAAAAALAAATNTAAIQASIAACCCEVKERIGADGQMTRDLINSKDALNQAVKLQIANAELIANKLSPVV